MSILIQIQSKTPSSTSNLNNSKNDNYLEFTKNTNAKSTTKLTSDAHKTIPTTREKFC